MQKIEFFTGKGGTGKSTNAIIYALQKSIKKKIFLCSLDPAHNLKDILQVNSFSEIHQRFKNLDIQEPAIPAMLKEYLEIMENQLKYTHSYLSSFNLLDNFGLIKYSPGMEEYAIFYTFQKLYKKNNDIFIIDMPPTSLSLRFFSLAQLSVIWLDKLIDLRHKIINKKNLIDKVKKDTPEQDKVLLNLLKQKEKYKKLNDILLQSTIRIVLNPEPVSISESVNLLDKLEALGYKNIVIHVNKSIGLIDDKIKNLSLKYEVVYIPELENNPIGVDYLYETATKMMK